MRGQGESGRHAPGAREAREEKDEQERTEERSGERLFGILFLRTGSERAYTRATFARLDEKGKDEKSVVSSPFLPRASIVFREIRTGGERG